MRQRADCAAGGRRTSTQSIAGEVVQPRLSACGGIARRNTAMKDPVVATPSGQPASPPTSKPAAPRKQALAAPESPRATKLYDRPGDEITPDEVAGSRFGGDALLFEEKLRYRSTPRGIRYGARAMRDLVLAGLAVFLLTTDLSLAQTRDQTRPKAQTIICPTQKIPATWRCASFIYPTGQPHNTPQQCDAQHCQVWPPDPNGRCAWQCPAAIIR